MNNTKSRPFVFHVRFTLRSGHVIQGVYLRDKAQALKAARDAIGVSIVASDVRRVRLPRGVRRIGTVAQTGHMWMA